MPERITSQPSLSIVLTHYNKGSLIERTVASLMSQKIEINEIIIVDDASTLADWHIVKQRLLQHTNIHIIENTHNRGPARRLAQGLACVCSDYVFMMDGDDVVGLNALADMWAEMRIQNADLAYGAVSKIKATDQNHQHHQHKGVFSISDSPLDFLFRHNHIQMCVLAQTSLIQKAGFDHAPSFIQDEYLALCLHRAAKRILYRHTATVFVLLEPNENKKDRASHRLSGHINQQHYDHFLSYQDFFVRYQAVLSLAQRRHINRRLYSIYYKSKKYNQHQTIGDTFYYIASRALPQTIYQYTQLLLSQYFAQLNDVRRL